MTRLSSRKYLDGAKGETCKLRIAGVCNGDRATVVACHIRDGHTGRSIKASDVSVVDGCHLCHEVFDLRERGADGTHLSKPDWLFYALRGLQETLENRIARGILKFPHDEVKTRAETPTKPRKPKEKRQRIVTRAFQKGKTTIPSRPFPARGTK